MNKERLYERLDDLKRANSRLEEATNIEMHNEIIIDGVIQRFEFTFELSWKLMKMFMQYNGISEVKSPRGAIQEAFSYSLIENGEQWIDMMVDHNKTLHQYDEEEARLIYEKIKNIYRDLLLQFRDKIEYEIKKST